MDLMFFSPKINGKTGALNVVDVHSRKAFSVLIANKKEATVMTAFQKILAEIVKDGKKVRHVNSDDGKEFVSVWKMLTDNGIQVHKSRKEEFAKNAIVERFNRTARNLMRKYEAEFGRAGMIEDWDELIDNYTTSRITARSKLSQARCGTAVTRTSKIIRTSSMPSRRVTESECFTRGSCLRRGLTDTNHSSIRSPAP